MIKNLFYLLGVATIATSCTKENLGNDINSDDLITMNISASMPDSPINETESRTVIDAVTASNISLKWSETDKNIYYYTAFKDNKNEGKITLGTPKPITATGFSDDMKSVYFTPNFTQGSKKHIFVILRIQKRLSYQILR